MPRSPWKKTSTPITGTLSVFGAAVAKWWRAGLLVNGFSDRLDTRDIVHTENHPRLYPAQYSLTPLNRLTPHLFIHCNLIAWFKRVEKTSRGDVLARVLYDFTHNTWYTINTFPHYDKFAWLNYCQNTAYYNGIDPVCQYSCNVHYRKLFSSVDCPAWW